MKLARAALIGCAIATMACAGRCGGEKLPVVTGSDGKQYRLMDKGMYKAWYSMDNRLQRIEYDNNGDGRAEQVDHHDGAARPRLTELDANSDGKVERWEYYDGEGHLQKIALSKAGARQDEWVTFDAKGERTRVEYDRDGDGKVERADVYAQGRLVAEELDGDRDGQVDRWQRWAGTRLEYEDLDTDRDGRADRRLRYDENGNVASLQPIAATDASPGPAPSGR